MFFDARFSASYGNPIIGRWTEPETIRFIEAVCKNISDLTFINVGSNTGEMCLTITDYPNSKIIACEPISGCCQALEKSLILNNYHSFIIHNCAVGEKDCYINFYENKRFSGLSSVYETEYESCAVRMSRLDSIIDSNSLKKNHILILIDVEGYELNVLHGLGLLINMGPIIVFEYNSVSKRHFKMNDMLRLLPNHYQIFRIAPSSMLDGDIENSRNCVAIPKSHHLFESLAAREL